MPPHENIESSLIYYRGTRHEDYHKWTDALDKFLAGMNCEPYFLIRYWNLRSHFFCSVYKTPGLGLPGRGQNIFGCKYNMPPPPGKVCDVNIKEFRKCTQENYYSYHKSSPCIFLKLNKIYGWVPEFYNRTENLPAKMPRQLIQTINQTDPMEVSTACDCKCFARCLLINMRSTWFSWTPFGYPARARIQLMSKTLDQSSTIHAKAFRDTIIRTRTPKVIWVHWLPSISNSRCVSFLSLYQINANAVQYFNFNSFLSQAELSSTSNAKRGLAT